MAEWSDFYRSQMSYERHLQAHYLRELLKTILKYWRGGTVLEVGTGTGYMAVYLSKLGIPVKAVDADKEILNNCRWANQVLEGSAEFIHCDAFRLEAEFSGQRFDLAYHQGLFEHFTDEDIRTLIQQQFAVADRVICSVPSKFYPQQDYGNERLLSVGNWQEILMPWSTSVEEIGYFGHSPEGKEHVHFVLRNPFYSEKDKTENVESPAFTRPVKPSVVWESLVFHPSGYASIARNSMIGMYQRGIGVSVREIPSSISISLDTATRSILTDMVKTPPKPGSPYVFHHPPAGHKGERFFSEAKKRNPNMGKYICSMMFETDRIPKEWVDSAREIDEIWVPTHFNKETFSSSGIPEDKLKIMPFGIDTKLFDPDKTGDAKFPGHRSFNFLSVFEWTKRKGWDILLQAFLKEFDYREDVALNLIVYRGTGTDRSDTETVKVKAFRYMTEVLGVDPEKKPHINLIDSVFSYQEMPTLYKAADVFVLPTRGEGWGMPYMEAMAMGVPVIATNWSGHMEFVTEENGYLIDIKGLSDVDEEQVKDNPYYAGHKWAEPSVRSLRKLMRHTFENRDEVEKKGRTAYNDIRAKFTLSRAGEHIQNRIFAILDEKQVPPAPVQAGPVIPPVVWEAPVFDPSGYASDARNIILGLSRSTATNLQVTPVFWSNLKIGLKKDDEMELVDLSTGPQFEMQKSINIQHVFPPMFKQAGKSLLCAGRTMFETDRIPKEWVKLCNAMDALFVPTDFNIETFAKAGVKKEKLYKLPFCIEPEMFDTQTAPLYIPERKKFNFLSVFDWSFRKGWDVLLSAFLEEFTADDDVALILQTYSSYGLANTDIITIIQAFIQKRFPDKADSLARIVMLQRVLSEQEMIQLYAASDCFVLPSRGEGWGRPYMEAMAMGKPVIGTRWSGNLEFMNDDNSYLIDCTVEDVPEFAYKEIPTFKGHQWAEPDPVHTRKLMREVYENPAKAKTVARQAREDVLTKYNRKTVAGIFVNTVKSILADTVVTEQQPPFKKKTRPESAPKIKKATEKKPQNDGDEDSPLPLFSDLG